MTQQAPGGPTVRRMLVGSRLRRLRIEAGISREQAGEAIRASEWKIHRLENGQVGFKERDIVDLLTLYGADPGEVAAVVGMALDANDTGWWHQYGDVLPQWFRAYVDLEQAATIIRSYEGQFIPGLLQTDDYARSVIGRGLDEAASGIERRVELRAARQGMLTRPDPPRLWAVVDEAALRPNVTLQVLPFGVGAHPAMVGAFSILRFADVDLPDVVYLEHLTGAIYLDKREDVRQYLHVMENVCVRSAPPDYTPDILADILKDLEGA